MGLFGSDEDEREEVTIGISEEEEEENDTGEAEVSPEVGTVDFGGSSSSEKKGEESNLRNEVSSLDSVKEAEMDSQKTNTNSGSATSSTGSSDIKDIKKQNQKIIEKLDKVLSKL